MNRVCSIFAQLLQLFPRGQFEQAVKKHQAERHARGFTCWGQFVAMLFCHLGAARSLREICNGLAASEGKLKHLGISVVPIRSTLSYANKHRPWQLYETVFYEMFERCSSLAAGKKKFRFKNKLLSLDSTSIDLCASLFDWARYKRTKGAVKLHLLLDNEGYLPCFARITDGKSHDVTVARTLHFQPGTIVVMDKGYVDYNWWKRMGEDGVFFVTRLKQDLKYTVTEVHEVPKHSDVVGDCHIEFPATPQRRFALKLRKVTVRDKETGEELAFLTNHFKLGSTTIARIYRERWQIELFFKSVKQLLRVKTFVGTNANALKTQLWTALIAMLVLKYLQLRASINWSLSNLVALVRQQLFVYRDLYRWLDHPFEAPPALEGRHDGQLVLDF